MGIAWNAFHLPQGDPALKDRVFQKRTIWEGNEAPSKSPNTIPSLKAWAHPIQPLSKISAHSTSPSELDLFAFSEKIKEYAQIAFQTLVSLGLFCMEGDLSKKMYHIAQITLSTFAWSGYVITISILIVGYTKLACIIFIFSSGCLSGALIAYQAKNLQSLETSANKFEEQNKLLEKNVQNLEKQVNILSETNTKLKTEVSKFAKQNQEFRKGILYLQKANATLHKEITSLKLTREQLDEQVALLTTQNAQLQAFAEKHKKELENLNTQHKAHIHSYEKLLKQFSTQFALADQKQQSQFDKAENTQKELFQKLQQHVAALSDLRPLGNLEEKVSQATERLQALEQKAKSTEKEIKRRDALLTTMEMEIKEKNATLTALKQAHALILKEHLRALNTQSGITERLEAVTSRLESQFPL